MAVDVSVRPLPSRYVPSLATHLGQLVSGRVGAPSTDGRGRPTGRPRRPGSQAHRQAPEVVAGVLSSIALVDTVRCTASSVRSSAPRLSAVSIAASKAKPGPWAYSLTSHPQAQDLSYFEHPYLPERHRRLLVR